jgi:hypothetical protein
MSEGTLEVLRIVVSIVAVWFVLVGWKLLPLFTAPQAESKPEGR